MSKRIQQRVNINGETKWISGSTQQEIFEAYLAQAIKSGLVMATDTNTPPPHTTPLFGNYLLHFIETYKSKQCSATVVNRMRIVQKHVLPRLGNMPIHQIGTADIQVWFDELCEQGYSRETILKIKNIISPAFDSAIEDDFIRKNPVKSKRLTINTQKGGHHKAIPPEKMMVVRNGIGLLPLRERRIVALLSYTGMRLEEVLGLRWEDLNCEEQTISIQRAVVHPKRHTPVIKPPKTQTSIRVIPLISQLVSLLSPMESTGFILGGDEPLTYQQQKRSFDKIRAAFGLEAYSAHDFRDTCATEWQENGMSLENISRLLGHSSTTVTEKCYVKFRQKALTDARSVMEQIGGDVAKSVAE